MSHYSTEDFEDYESDDSYDTESLCSNDSYESSFIDCESTEDDTEDEFSLSKVLLYKYARF